MDNLQLRPRQISLFGLLGIVTAIAVVLGLSQYFGLLIPAILIGWFTVLCFCRRIETLGFVFFGVPLLVVLGGGIIAALAGIARVIGLF